MYKRQTYTRLLRGAVPRILDDYDYELELGKAKVVRPGDDAVFVASGLMTMRALLAAEELAKDGIDVSVVHVATLKPFDEETVVRAVDTDRAVFTLENHTVIGGLFESVAAALIRRGIGRQVSPIALPDAFIDAGALPTLHDRYGLATRAVVARVREVLRSSNGGSGGAIACRAARCDGAGARRARPGRRDPGRMSASIRACPLL